MVDNVPEKYKTDNRLLVVQNRPLLYYPELNDSDIHNCDVISKEQKEVLLASLNFKKIRDINLVYGSGSQEYDDLAKIIGTAIWVMGITEKSMSDSEQEMFIPLAIEEIKNEFSQLSIEDIRIAFKKGSRRHYGDTFQMSIVNINVWLNAYIEETKPIAMLKLPMIKKEEEVKELTEEEKEKLHKYWLNGVYREFNNFKETGFYTFHDFKNSFFFYCQKLGLINLTDEHKEIIWNKAKQQLQKEYNPNNERLWGRKIDLKAIYDVLKLDEVNDDKVEKLIATRSRRIALKHFFKKLIKEDKDLKDVVEMANLKLEEKFKSEKEKE